MNSFSLVGIIYIYAKETYAIYRMCVGMFNSSHTKIQFIKLILKSTSETDKQRTVYRDKGTPPKKGGGSSFTVTKLPSSLELKGQRSLSLPHSP